MMASKPLIEMRAEVNTVVSKMRFEYLERNCPHVALKEIVDIVNRNLTRGVRNRISGNLQIPTLEIL